MDLRFYIIKQLCINMMPNNMLDLTLAKQPVHHILTFTIYPQVNIPSLPSRWFWVILSKTKSFKHT